MGIVRTKTKDPGLRLGPYHRCRNAKNFFDGRLASSMLSPEFGSVSLRVNSKLLQSNAVKTKLTKAQVSSATTEVPTKISSTGVVGLLEQTRRKEEECVTV